MGQIGTYDNGWGVVSWGQTFQGELISYLSSSLSHLSSSQDTLTINPPKRTSDESDDYTLTINRTSNESDDSTPTINPPERTSDESDDSTLTIIVIVVVTVASILLIIIAGIVLYCVSSWS